MVKTTVATPPVNREPIFWQLNAFVGYRFPHRKAELPLGLLNITGQNYNFNPLNLYNEMPRSRTLALSLQVNF